MGISATAARNHERLFPGHVSTLKVTDPELIEVFDTFAFDEVPACGSLDERTRMMAILAALIAGQALGEYRAMLQGALNLGVTPVEVKEIVYQAVPYCGIGLVYDFLQATNEILAGRGIKLPLEGQSTTTRATRFARGLALQREIFGERIDRMHREVPEDEAHLNRFLAAHCFGDHLTRTGLDLQTRELLTFAMLLSLRGCEAQLKGHIEGNLRLGNDRTRLLDVLTQLLPYLGYPRTLNALRCLDEVAPPTPQARPVPTPSQPGA
jgi:4-carboxymuconolactone decarboxylase